MEPAIPTVRLSTAEACINFDVAADMRSEFRDGDNLNVPSGTRGHVHRHVGTR